MKSSRRNREGLWFDKRLLAGVFVLILCAFPLFVGNPYLMRLAILVFIFSILSMSLNLLLGFTGIISLGHAAFFGVGAYATAVLSTKLHQPFLLVLPVSAIAPTVLALVFGLITLRALKELYFALAVWGLGEILYAVYVNTGFLGRTNGIGGIPAPGAAGFTISSDMGFYYLSLVFALVTLVSLELIIVSRIGRAFIAIRENETVAGIMGIDALKYQVLSLAVSSFYAGIAGSLYAYYETYISPGSFTIWESIVLVCMVLVGGRQSLLGSAFGALILIAIPELLRELGEYRMLIYGAIMFLVIMFRPKGLIPPVYFLKASERRKHVLAID